MRNNNYDEIWAFWSGGGSNIARHVYYEMWFFELLIGNIDTIKTLCQRNVSISVSASVSFQFLCCKKLFCNKRNIFKNLFISSELSDIHSLLFKNFNFPQRISFLLCWKSFSSFICLNHFKNEFRKAFDSLYTTLTRTIC